MIHSMRNIDTSSELLIQRWQNGVKLIKPDASLSNSEHSVAHILKLPFNICFMDTKSALQRINETCAKTCGMPSTTTFIGRNASAFVSAQEAAQLFINDQSVLHNNKIKIFNEHMHIMDDGLLTQYISVKSPWYDRTNKIIGIFNCAIALNKHDLETGLTSIAKLGLLPQSNQPEQQLPLKTIDNVIFSRREIQCLEFYIRGKTAKMIAKILGLSHRTIEHYLENLKRKLRVGSKSELIEKAMELLSV